MRKTKASLIYERTKNLRAVQILLGHTELESTVRYLGVEVDDALELSIPDISILSKNSSYRSKAELIEVVDYECFVLTTAALQSSKLINNYTAVMLKYHPSE
jgi:hypothetical protein